MSLSRLSSLTDYQYTTVEGAGTAQLTFVGRIHSSTNFVISLGTTHTYFVAGQAYEVLGSLAPQKITLNSGYLQNQGEIVAARGFVDLTRAAGVKVIPGGSCSVAGISGRLYKEETPANGGLFKIAQQGCVANQGGALLSFQEGVSGSVAPNGGGQTVVFTVTGVGDVGPISLP